MSALETLPFGLTQVVLLKAIVLLSLVSGVAGSTWGFLTTKYDSFAWRTFSALAGFPAGVALYSLAVLIGWSIGFAVAFLLS